MKALQGQSLFDIATIHLGSSLGAYDLAALNGLSVTDKLTPGQELLLPPVINKSIVDYYANKGIQPATEYNEEIDSVDRVFFEELPIEFM